MPVLIWAGIAAAGALGVGSWAAGKEAGKGAADALKWLALGAGAVVVYRMTQGGR
ncbi:hypothetical protein [Rhodobacter capsulatus]|uniref:hypothetical protein n=1 Tax=Rhodobacter capsulatus TaxID=1061 RepID=UPI00402A2565